MISANGVIHISYHSETHPYFYVGMENTITCSASNFTSLSQLNLIYVDQSTSSIVFNAGCDMDELGVWSSNNTGLIALKLNVHSTSDNECQSSGEQLMVDFTVEVKTPYNINGHFYCKGIESATSSDIDSGNIELKDVRGEYII